MAEVVITAVAWAGWQVGQVQVVAGATVVHHDIDAALGAAARPDGAD
jgi:hypothetical protein